MKLFLIDAYALIYRSYYALIRSPRINSKGLNTSAVMGFVNTLWEVIQKEQPTHLAVAFDHGKTFRHEAYPPYKAQREETPEDIRLSIPIIKDILAAWHIPCLQYDGYEADDIIGTIAKYRPTPQTPSRYEGGGVDTSANETHPLPLRGGETNDTSADVSPSDNIDITPPPYITGGGQGGGSLVFMLTPDKDYAQLVGDGVYMYKPRHGGGYDILGAQEVCEKYTISSPEQVIDLLALMGDSADNFPGCPGVGEKTAIKLINQFGSCEELIARADEIKGALQTKVKEHVEDIKISKFLARIKTDIPELLADLPTLLPQMEVTAPDAERLTQLFDELEFRNLAKKILGRGVEAGAASSSSNATSGNNTPAETLKNVNAKKSKQSKKVVTGELDLFGLFADEGTEEIVQAQDFSLAEVQHDYQLADSLEDAKKVCDFLLTTQKLCFDTETTSTVAIDAKLVGMSFCAEQGKAYYVSVPGKMDEVAEMFRPLFEADNIEKVGQNMKYDIEVLAHYNIKVRGVKRDTMVAHYLLHPELRHNMDYMAETMLSGYKTIHYDDLVPRGKTMADLQPSAVKDYACEDADITWQLWTKLEPQLKEVEGLWQLFEDVEMPLVDVLADMEMTGVCIKSDTLAEVSTLFTERMNAHEQRIYELANHSFNISSPRQVGQVLFEEMHIIDKPKKTKTGQYVTSEEVLQTLAKDHEIVSEILAYRGLKKLIGTYVDALPRLVNPRTGHIHTSFNQCITATGRLSSSDPNLQNIPIRDDDGKEIRRCFVADEGCLFFSADYSQIELRVMAHLSGDEEMQRAFREDYDIHAATAANVYHKERQDVTREERTKAKRANFGIIYGISAWGLSQSMEIDRKEARALMDGFFTTFPRVKDYMDASIERVKEEARQRCDEHGGNTMHSYGYTRTLLHRRRKLDNINSSNATVRSLDERNAINAPIQGSAADIIKIAMVRIWRRFQEEGLRSKMILQVHDELNFSVLPEERDRVESIVLEEMQRAYPLNVPLIADSGWGENWLDAH